MDINTSRGVTNKASRHKVIENRIKEAIETGKDSYGYGIAHRLLMCDPDLEFKAKVLWCYLASFAGDSGIAYPAIPTICADLRCTKDIIFRCIKNLKDKGYLTVTKYKKRPNDFGHNVYHLHPVPENHDITTKTIKDEGTQLPSQYRYGRASKLLLQSDLSMGAKAEYCLMSSYAGKFKTCSIAKDGICNKLKISANAHTTYLTELRDKKFITIDTVRKTSGAIDHMQYNLNDIIDTYKSDPDPCEDSPEEPPAPDVSTGCESCTRDNCDSCPNIDDNAPPKKASKQEPKKSTPKKSGKKSTKQSKEKAPKQDPKPTGQNEKSATNQDKENTSKQEPKNTDSIKRKEKSRTPLPIASSDTTPDAPEAAPSTAPNAEETTGEGSFAIQEPQNHALKNRKEKSRTPRKTLSLDDATANLSERKSSAKSYAKLNRYFQSNEQFASYTAANADEIKRVLHNVAYRGHINPNYIKKTSIDTLTALVVGMTDNRATQFLIDNYDNAEEALNIFRFSLLQLLSTPVSTLGRYKIQLTDTQLLDAINNLLWVDKDNDRVCLGSMPQMVIPNFLERTKGKHIVNKINYMKVLIAKAVNDCIKWCYQMCKYVNHYHEDISNVIVDGGYLDKALLDMDPYLVVSAFDTSIQNEPRVGDFFPRQTSLTGKIAGELIAYLRRIMPDILCSPNPEPVG